MSSGAIAANDSHVNTGTLRNSLAQLSAAKLEEVLVVQDIPVLRDPEGDVRSFFSNFGNVSAVSVVSPHTALVRFASSEPVAYAVAATKGATWHGSQLRVDSAADQLERMSRADELHHAGIFGDVGPPACISSMDNSGSASPSHSAQRVLQRSSTRDSDQPSDRDGGVVEDNSSQRPTGSSMAVDGLVRCDPSWTHTPLNSRDHALLHESLESRAPSGSASASHADPLEELEFDFPSLHDESDVQRSQLQSPAGAQQSSRPRPDTVVPSYGGAASTPGHSAAGGPSASAAPHLGATSMQGSISAMSLVGARSGSPGLAPPAAHTLSQQDSVASAARQDIALMAQMSTIAQGRRDAAGSPWAPTTAPSALTQDPGSPLPAYAFPMGPPGVLPHSPRMYGGGSSGPGTSQQYHRSFGSVESSEVSADSMTGAGHAATLPTQPLMSLDMFLGQDFSGRDLHLLTDEQQALLIRHCMMQRQGQQQHPQQHSQAHQQQQASQQQQQQQQLHSPPMSRMTRPSQQHQQAHGGMAVGGMGSSAPHFVSQQLPLSQHKQHAQHYPHHMSASLGPTSPETERGFGGLGSRSLRGSLLEGAQESAQATLQVAAARDRTGMQLPQTPAKMDHAAMSSSPTVSQSLLPTFLTAGLASGAFGGSGHSSRTSSPPPLPRRSTLDSGLGSGSSGMTGSGGTGGSSGGGGMNSVTAAALVQLMVERGMDQTAMLNLLQNPRMMEALEGQQRSGRDTGLPPAAAPIASGGMATGGHMGSGGGGGGHQQWASKDSGQQQQQQQRLSRVSPTALSVGEMRSSALPSGGSGSQRSSMSGLQPAPTPAVPVNVLNSHLLTEFTSARNVLVQLMLSAYAFLNSESMEDFYAKVAPVAALYDSMHDLSVMQKRKKCLEMAIIRQRLLQDPSFVQILQAICALRHHLYSLSRKVLLMNQGPDGVPVDLLLGSMSSELYHLMKAMLPQEVSDFFGNNLPFSKLAVLVFGEFTTVDPMPTLT